MEEENRKARRSKRKEYNDTMRELVAFVRKRVRGRDSHTDGGKDGGKHTGGEWVFQEMRKCVF